MNFEQHLFIGFTSTNPTNKPHKPYRNKENYKICFMKEEIVSLFVNIRG